MPEPRTTAARARRRGRRPRTYAAVLAATSELLETVPLAQLSVARIIAAAGVSRTSFYEHFNSKEDVVVKLVRSISAELADEIEPMFARDTAPGTGQDGPEQAFREGLSRMLRACVRHAPLVLAASEEWPAVPELQRLWFRMHGALTRRLAELIATERADGRAPEGADPEALAACLVWTGERSFHVAMTGAVPALAGYEALIEPLVQLYVGSIYRRPVRITPGA
jgi:TetR/AcrR family transcriptional regulator, ethionamide resistance regulator